MPGRQITRGISVGSERIKIFMHKFAFIVVLYRVQSDELA